VVKNSKRNSLFVSFTPAVSNKALTAMRATTRKLSYRNRTELSLADISRLHNPSPEGLAGVLRKILSVGDVPRLQALQQDVGGLGDKEVQTAQRALDTGRAGFSNSFPRRSRISSCIGRKKWSVRLLDGSGVNREVHAPFCERPGVQLLRPTCHENNNTLKTKGYHFDHNFGHGKHFLANLFATLILLAFLVHTALDWIDTRYAKVRGLLLPSRRTFFEHLRALLQYLPFDDWDHLMRFMQQRLAPNAPDTG
jgi:hypothetical protein